MSDFGREFPQTSPIEDMEASQDQNRGVSSSNLPSSGRVEHPWQHDSGAYAEVDEIGNGAYATVLRGRHRVTGAEVALKKITIPVSEEGVPQSVIREISLLKRFERYGHPHIVRLLDVCHGLSDNHRQLYMNLVFEYCPQDLGMFLQGAITAGVSLAESTIRRMMGEIIAGVKFLHDQAVMHRDLKPQNVLITADGRMKIADYGLARMYSLQAAMTTVVVTLWYRSPELLLQCDYGFGVDVWSIGCMMAEMYRLRPLFPGKTEVDQLKKIFQIVGIPPAGLWPNDAVVDRASFQDLPVTSSLRKKLGRISTTVFDLICRMLAFCPNQRITVNSILEHPYFFETMAPLAHSSSSSSSYSDDTSNGL